MNVLFYLPLTSEIGSKIQGVVKMAKSMARTEIFRSIGDLSSGLCRPADGFTIAVIVTGTREDLANIISIRQLLSGISVILVLSDSHDETIAAGHKLYPRFLTFMDSNLMEVGAVLEKMIQYYEKREAAFI